ncbi:VCBS repeat-containing protein [Spirosoma areae]
MCWFASGCREGASDQQNTSATGSPLFTSLSPEQTGVSFANNLTEGLNTNVLMYEYFYNGGGVAVGDLNDDGFEDIYFSGNMVPNQLYLNKGGMKFADVTAAAGVAGREGPWRTGVSMADVNGDGRLDLFLCYSGSLPPHKRIPQLFINDGPDAQGVPHFSEQTTQWGLDRPGQTTQGTFFDYDRDGDLDLFLLNHNPRLLPVLDPGPTSALLQQSNPEIGVRLLQNTGSYFNDVTERSGLSSSVLSYGLGLGVSDLNGDGWPDLYISNDYTIPDYLYINNGNGTFTNQLKTSIRHTSQFSMGNDVADVNNDALPDIMTLDMLPEDNRRQKLLMAPDNYEKYDLAVASGFHYQHMRNMLQLNEGAWSVEQGAGGRGTSTNLAPRTLPLFSEVGQIAGISNTDWSWSPLLADYDNDGWKDLYVTNGYVRDYTNQDFLKYMTDYMQNRPANFQREDVLELVHKIPSSNVMNYMFRNRGGETSGESTGPSLRPDGIAFANVGAAWGLTQTSNSTGAAYADLDNDGDLDLVVNNTNQSAFIFRNETNKERKHHYLSVKLVGNQPNTQGIGAKVTIYQKNKQQYVEQMPTRGYQSGMSPRLHFGLGADSVIDSLRIVWPTGKQQLLASVKADQMLTVQEKEAQLTYRAPTGAPALFREVKTPVAFADPVNKTNDFKRQSQLVNAQSFGGPCMAKADVNGDGREDVFVGGSSGQAGVLFIQQAPGQFSRRAQAAFDADKASNNTDAVFFDANADGFPDLYVCSGGYGDLTTGDPRLRDRLYLNDGKGNFSTSPDALPVMQTSSGCVRVADVNADGRPDLFVGGRVMPGRYPETPKSFLLVNTGTGRFTDQTAKLAPGLSTLGMVTDAAWVDLNADKKAELVVVGEWMPVTVLGWSNNQLTDQTKIFFEKEYRGWWNKLLVDDLNGDGRPDLVIGNQGLNTQCRASDREPAELLYKDFDNNGKIDPILCLYVQGKSYPHATRDELLDQVGMLRHRFTNYDSYANATLTDVFRPEELADAKKLTANQLQTTCFVSTPAGKLTEKPLPVAAQISPVFAITVVDYNKDGHKDLLLCGNTTQTRLRFGRADANYGLLLRGEGKGAFSAVPQQQSGFQITGDVRSVLSIGNTLLFGINQQTVRAYESN